MTGPTTYPPPPHMYIINIHMFICMYMHTICTHIYTHLIIHVCTCMHVQVVLAYRYTSITSVMLLDCFAIPCAMLLSRLLLKSRYRRLHLVGVALCVTGLGVTVLSDKMITGTEDSSYPHALLGDGLCLAGAALYAASNVLQARRAGLVLLFGVACRKGGWMWEISACPPIRLILLFCCLLLLVRPSTPFPTPDDCIHDHPSQEALVKAHDRAEFLGMLGALGAALSGMQVGWMVWWM